jgi:hypothetical protein
VSPDEIVVANVDLAMSHENADLVRKSFHEIGVKRVWDPDRIVIILDHRVPAESEKTATTHKAIREFVAAQGIRNFYDVGRGGICHQVLAERGHVAPGMVVVGTDSHTTTHGAFGAFAAGIGATEMAGVWTEGKLWFKVPSTLRIEVDEGPDPVHHRQAWRRWRGLPRRGVRRACDPEPVDPFAHDYREPVDGDGRQVRLYAGGREAARLDGPPRRGVGARSGRALRAGDAGRCVR